jgi:hypothetical protein
VEDADQPNSAQTPKTCFDFAPASRPCGGLLANKALHQTIADGRPSGSLWRSQVNANTLGGQA